MRNRVLLLIAIIALYLLTSLTLNLIYGSSYPFLRFEDRWEPDGSGGWRRKGHPSEPTPVEPSLNVPLLVHYLPIFLPSLLLIVFLFTPLTRLLERPPAEPEDETSEPDEANHSA